MIWVIYTTYVYHMHQNFMTNSLQKRIFKNEMPPTHICGRTWNSVYSLQYKDGPVMYFEYFYLFPASIFRLNLRMSDP